MQAFLVLNNKNEVPKKPPKPKKKRNIKILDIGFGTDKVNSGLSMAFEWHPNERYYSYSPKSDVKDRINVEIGDIRDVSTVQPHFKIMRWDGEISASIRLNYSSIPGNITYDDNGETIHWRKGQWEAWFYHVNSLDEGGLEFEIHIPRKPPTNCIEFIVETNNLDWLYQPPLANTNPDGSTWQESPNGSRYERPANVNGSYAVYHKTKGRLNDANGKDYKVGKAFHIYRPHAVDSLGNSIYADLDYNELTNVLTICIDQTWLDNAEYPIIVDPTFGYTTVGGSNAIEVSSYTIGCRYQLTETASTITQLSFRTFIVSGNGKAAIYTDSSDSPNTRFAQQTTPVALVSDNWTNFSFSTGEASSGWYWLVINSDANFQVKYDTDASYKKAYDAETYTGVFKDPFGTVEGYDASVKYSSYATYTAGGVTKSVGDTGAGSDSKPTISASLSRSDAGSGIDNQTLAALLGLSESALGGDFLDLLASLSTQDIGTGSDAIAISVAIVGSTVWGHITSVQETNIRTFATNWTGTGLAEGSGDSERLRLCSGEYMISEVVETGVIEVTLLQNNYGSGDTVLLQYRHGASISDCQSASWNTYTVPFISLGFVQVRVESTV